MLHIFGIETSALTIGGLAQERLFRSCHDRVDALLAQLDVLIGRQKRSNLSILNQLLAFPFVLEPRTLNRLTLRRKHTVHDAITSNDEMRSANELVAEAHQSKYMSFAGRYLPAKGVATFVQNDAFELVDCFKANRTLHLFLVQQKRLIVQSEQLVQVGLPGRRLRSLALHVQNQLLLFVQRVAVSANEWTVVATRSLQVPRHFQRCFQSFAVLVPNAIVQKPQLSVDLHLELQADRLFQLKQRATQFDVLSKGRLHLVRQNAAEHNSGR
jgi:hypothetical protein